MPRKLPPVDDHIAGDTLFKTITITDSYGDPLDIRNGEVEWALVDYLEDDVYLDEDDEDVESEITDGENGEVQIRLRSSGDNDGATADMRGHYRQRLRIWDGQGNRNTYIGEFRIKNVGV